MENSKERNLQNKAMFGRLIAVSLLFLPVMVMGSQNQLPGEHTDSNTDFMIITGKNKNINSRYVATGHWSVGNATHQLRVVSEPISDMMILPFSDPVPNVQTGDRLTIVGARGEYEASSFVIRSGNSPLSDVVIGSSDFKGEEGRLLPGSIVDMRIVKAWFQASKSIRRTKKDTKQLVPELLLHNADLVQVDMERQINIFPHPSKLNDAETLLPFSVPGRMNQQVWISVNIPASAYPGVYEGSVRITFSIDGNVVIDSIPITVKVLPFELDDPLVEYAMFYTGRLQPPGWSGVDARAKTREQMLADFEDMARHGLTNIALERDDDPNIPNGLDTGSLKESLAILKQAGLGKSMMLYVDWKLRGSDDPRAYARKMEALRDATSSVGFEKTFIYNLDEKNPAALVDKRKTMDISHEYGMGNFVATIPSHIEILRGLLDIAILHRDEIRELDRLRKLRIVPWAYGKPQAGEESPGTYRQVYGVSLWMDGFDGACAYAYQTGPDKFRSGWDDWASDNWRPHMMTYPTVSGPIPTLQWEGWREGIDDSRYMATLFAKREIVPPVESKSRRAVLAKLLGSTSSDSPTELRTKIIRALLKD